MKRILKQTTLVFMLLSVMGMSNVPADADKDKSVQFGNTIIKSHANHTVKPHAKIDLHYLISKHFVVNTPETISFTLVNGVDADDVIVRFIGDEALILNTSPTEISFGAATVGSKHDFKVQITPTANGLYYLDIIASMLIDGKYQTRAFVVPVSVGEYDLGKQHKPMGVLGVENGQKVITLPAVETTQ